ncbi:hypothetical protein LTR08_002286 [Meristemomyces frigidus]|nr:hypothetical protein LTR08_002286 [Meristemomyces frigidus]
MDSDEGVKKAIAHSDNVYYAAARLHGQGIPQHALQKNRKGSTGNRTTSGYRVDWTSNFTARIIKVASLVANNKRIAFHLLTAKSDVEYDDIVRAPASYLKRRIQNFVQNEKKSVDLKQAAEKRQTLGTPRTEQASELSSVAQSPCSPSGKRRRLSDD